MAFRIRRIVTERDARGKAVVKSDGYVESAPGKIDRNISAADVWWTHCVPADISGHDATSEPSPGMPTPAGTLLKVLELAPGTKPVMHETRTLDYVIVLDGEVVMLLDDGAEVHMKAGDLMIQRGTLHGWANRSDKPCRIAFVLVSAAA
jgi:quercetin dioxygenase-like cupin family protein